MESDAAVLARALGIDDELELERMLSAVGGLGGLAVAGAEVGRGLRPPTRRRLDAILELFIRAHRPAPRPSPIERPEDLVALLGPQVVTAPVEMFWVVSLDARGRPKGVTQVAQGTLSACLVHPREVFASAIRARAASVLLAHNHPSGCPEPSPEDQALTERLVEAGQLLGIPVLDHVIVAEGGFCSLGGAGSARKQRADEARTWPGRPWRDKVGGRACSWADPSGRLGVVRGLRR